MMDLVHWLGANYSVLLVALLALVGGCAVAAKAVAPLTKTKWDDKLAGKLTKLHNFLKKLALHSEK